jgi:hypothetical protein
MKIQGMFHDSSQKKRMKALKQDQDDVTNVSSRWSQLAQIEKKDG